MMPGDNDRVDDVSPESGEEVSTGIVGSSGFDSDKLALLKEMSAGGQLGVASSLN